MPKPLAHLTRDDLVQILALAGRNRRAVKRYLHDRDFPAGADAVDDALNLINQRPDAREIVSAAAAINSAKVRSEPARFSLVEQVVRVMADRGIVGEQAVHVLSERSGVEADRVQAFLASDESIPLAEVHAILRAAGATAIRFSDPNQST